MGNLAVSPKSKKDIEKIAKKIRALFNWNDLYFPIVQLLEILGAPDENGDVLLNPEIVPDEEMPNEYATYSPLQKTIRIRESVYEGAVQNNGRDRFTLAHELGHFVLHGSEEYRYARSGTEIPAYQDPEWQANTFASMLLMPRNMIKDMGVDEVAQRCATSHQAAAIALKK